MNIHQSINNPTDDIKDIETTANLVVNKNHVNIEIPYHLKLPNDTIDNTFDIDILHQKLHPTL